MFRASVPVSPDRAGEVFGSSQGLVSGFSTAAAVFQGFVLLRVGMAAWAPRSIGTSSSLPTILPNLTGNLDLPRLAASGSAAWGGEHTDAAGSDPTLSKKSMGPKTVSAKYEVSRRMLLQSNQALEPILRAGQANLLSQRLDSAGNPDQQLARPRRA